MSLFCEHLSKAFRTGGHRVLALEDVTFGVGEREFVSIVGPSGCGKTTLLKLVAGLLQPTSGRVVHDTDARDPRPATALVFQDHGLFPWMTVVENVAFGLETRGVARAERDDRALKFIASAGLAAFARAYPHQLSVGMRQRVGIARAFVSDPQLLLMDEPFGSLDAQTRLLLQEELLSLHALAKKAVVYVTHDIEEAVSLGDRVLVLTGRPGRLQGELSIPLARPRNLRYAATETSGEIASIKRRIWHMMENQARRDLSLSPVDGVGGGSE